MSVEPCMVLVRYIEALPFLPNGYEKTCFTVHAKELYLGRKGVIKCLATMSFISICELLVLERL